jgi:hypothetical protein
MSDQHRLTEPNRLSEAGATQAEEQLLLAGQQERLPEVERQAIWADIAARVAIPVPGQGPGATVSAIALSGAAGGRLIPGLVAVAVVGATAAAGYRALRPGQPQRGPERGEVTAPSRPSLAPSARPTGVAESLAPVTSSSSAAPAVAPLASVALASQLREESLAVLGIRQALRSGDASSALKLLEQARARFPRGALGQEREALTIEALAQSGAHAAAERRAAAFLRAYPNSPYAADVQRHTAH